MRTIRKRAVMETVVTPKPVLYLVIPCYNEQDILPIMGDKFETKLKSLIELGKINDNSKILFVNDGSKDRTWDIICKLSHSSKYFAGISQSRNRGHQCSILAGLMEAKDRCDITISIDCDGQDDINAIDNMVASYLDGNEIVYGVRSKRKTDTFFKRFSAECFYKFLNWMGGETVFNHADYRLISAPVLQELADFKEVNLFLRGMVPLIGFKSSIVYYERQERLAGESHYSFNKMVSLAFDGITSFSTKPLRMITGLGLLVSVLSFAGIVWSLLSKAFGTTVNSWTSVICIICFISGVQMISLGVIGEYIGKIYMETKARPRYIISERTDNMKNHTKD